MRTVKFKGKRSGAAEWVYGYPWGDDGNGNPDTITNKTGAYLIDVKTLGEYAGETDINDIEIYEGDIVKDRYGMTFVVILDAAENRFMGVTLCDAIWNERQGDVRYIRPQSVEEFELTVVGNKDSHKEYIKLLNESLQEADA